MLVGKLSIAETADARLPISLHDLRNPYVTAVSRDASVSSAAHIVAIQKSPHPKWGKVGNYGKARNLP